MQDFAAPCSIRGGLEAFVGLGCAQHENAGNLEIHGFGMSGFGLFGGSTGCWFRFLLGMLRTTPVLSEASPVTETTPLLRIVHRRPPSGANRPLFQLQLWKDITPFAITGPQPPKPHHSQSKHALDKTCPQMSE